MDELSFLSGEVVLACKVSIHLVVLLFVQSGYAVLHSHRAQEPSCQSFSILVVRLGMAFPKQLVKRLSCAYCHPYIFGGSLGQVCAHFLSWLIDVFSYC
jgi:hypothetical protein